MVRCILYSVKLHKIECGTSNEIKVKGTSESYQFMRAYHFISGHAVAQLVEALHYKPEGRGFNS
jgi:hypothetical protein